MAGQWRKAAQQYWHGRIRCGSTRHQTGESRNLPGYQRKLFGLFCPALSQITSQDLQAYRSTYGLTGDGGRGLSATIPAELGARPVPVLCVSNDAAKATTVFGLLTETKRSDYKLRRTEEILKHASQTSCFKNQSGSNWYHLTHVYRTNQRESPKRQQSQHLGIWQMCHSYRKQLDQNFTSWSHTRLCLMRACCHPTEGVFSGTGKRHRVALAPVIAMHVRCYRPNPRKRDRNYYEVLNITPNATQAQVKEAFFKLSKVYHPDKNAGSKEAQRQFSSINEAYSVLGNLTLRKRYDRGTLNQKDIYGEVREEEADKAKFSGEATYTTGGIPFHEEAERQAKKMDAFFESHYKAAREKEQQDRADRQRRVDEYMELQSKAKHSPIILATFIVTAVFLAVKSVIYDSKVDKKLRAAAKGKQ